MHKFSEYLLAQNNIANNLQSKQSLERLIQSLWKLVKDPSSIIFTIGNGGSASTAEHFSADLSQMEKRTGHSIRSFCLNSQIAISSAFANDFDYSSVIKKQLSAFREVNFALVAFSVSGNSQNILEAVNFTLELSKDVHCFTGFDGGKFKSFKKANIIHFPDKNLDYGMAENLHLTTCHFVIDSLIEKLREFI
jgi:D-sedoheptulose 7-phosphate isomerase